MALDSLFVLAVWHFQLSNDLSEWRWSQALQGAECFVRDGPRAMLGGPAVSEVGIPKRTPNRTLIPLKMVRWCLNLIEKS